MYTEVFMEKGLWYVQLMLKWLKKHFVCVCMYTHIHIHTHRERREGGVIKQMGQNVNKGTCVKLQRWFFLLAIFL